MEDYQKLYQNLPEDLKKALDDEKLALQTYTFGEKMGLGEEALLELARIMGEVFLGTLPPKDLAKAINERTELDKEKATSLAKDLSALFVPYKESLEKIYGKENIEVKEIEVESEEKPKFEAVIPEKEKLPEEVLKKIPQEKPQSYPKGYDPYREPISEEDLG